MCGIAGVLPLGGRLDASDAAAAERMTRALKHRGPDGIGVLSDERCVLGNARLRITDLSAKADLPMANEDGSVQLCYNGAVTNGAELKRSLGLESRYRFRTSSDAEIVLRAYEEMGIDFVRRLSGMFAFCLYDRRLGKAFLVRDFFGQRPLFYMVKEQKLYFASEIKSFLTLPGFDKSLDLDALHHFFSLAYMPGELTPFKAVRELEGGHLMEIDCRGGTLDTRRYYRLDYRADEALGEAAAARGLHEVLLDSVRRNIEVDVPVGLMLSGGVDTGILLGLLKELGVSRRTHTFSIRMNAPTFDESRYQRLLADFGGTIHHTVEINPADIEENLLSHMAYLDEPSGDGAAIPFFLLAKEARRHVPLLLSGEGGDEIFNGYETHRAYKARKLYRTWAPSSLRSLARACARHLPVSRRKLSMDFVLKRFTEGAELGTAEAHYHWRHVLSEEEKRRLLPGLGPRKPTSELFTELFESLPFEDELDRISTIDLTYYFIDDLMVKNDRMLMAHSVEARYPYTDRHVAEFSAAIPTRYKVKGLKGRSIQKLAMKGLIPDEIYRRSNMGLEMPHSSWFLRDLKGLADRYFSREVVGRSGLLDFSAVDGLWREHLAGRRDNGRALWCVLNFIVWFDLFVYNGDHADYR